MPAARGVGGRCPEKIDSSGFEASGTLKGAYILHFNEAIFRAASRKIFSFCAENFFEKRKKLDYEGILGYTSTNFESGG